MTPFIDTHSHLAMLKQAPVEEIIGRAHAAGIVKMITVSTDELSWPLHQELAMKHENIFFTLGIHPHDAKDWEGCKEKILSIYRSLPVPSKCVAIGEMGLDFFYNKSDREKQLEAFTEQLLLANELFLPVVIHSRDAFDELFEVIKRIGLSGRGGVMHCFTGNALEARRALDLGLKISFSGIITFKNTDPLREAAKIVPEGDLFIETDCPFLAPVPMRGKPNEPAYIRHTAECLASIRGTTVEQIGASTSQNATQFFRI